MKKSTEKVTKFYAYKKDTRKIAFTIRVILFDPNKHFVGTDEAKEYWRKTDRISKAKMKDEFCSVFASSTIVGKGKNKHIEFNKSIKDAANVIFIIPTKFRREFNKDLLTFEFPI